MERVASITIKTPEHERHLPWFSEVGVLVVERLLNRLKPVDIEIQIKTRPPIIGRLGSSGPDTSSQNAVERAEI